MGAHGGLGRRALAGGAIPDAPVATGDLERKIPVQPGAKCGEGGGAGRRRPDGKKDAAVRAWGRIVRNLYGEPAAWGLIPRLAQQVGPAKNAEQDHADRTAR